MEEEVKMTEDESLKLITQMISKAKNHFHESGTSAILWGSAIGIAGLVNFAEYKWHFYIGFDIWLLVLAALIPQIILTIRESRTRKVVTHTEAAIDTVWMVYGISMFALIFYFNVVPGQTDKIMASENLAIIQTKADGTKAQIHAFIPSMSSLLLILYALPTLVTGLAYKFRAMTFAAILCYVFFIISCYTSGTYDMLFNGLAGIFNWLIPGLLLRRKYFRLQKTMNV
jgi:hypothetical protein